MSGKPIIVVFTGNSNTGSVVIDELLANYGDNFTIRAVVRKKANGKHLEGKGVQIINADIRQPNLLKPVFADDVNVAFWSTPNTEDRAELTALFIDACIEYGVDFPIVISCLDADKGLTSTQRMFKAIEDYCHEKEGTPVKRQMLDTGKQALMPIILRCALFYQNIYGMISSLQQGVLYYPLGKNQGFMPHVDLADIGKVVGRIAADPEQHGGKTYNIIGEYHMGNQVATAITMGTKHSVTYEPVDDETAAMAFNALGMEEWSAVALVETLAYFRSEEGQDIPSDVEKLTGDAPIKFSTFAKNHLKKFLE
eukprot:m.76417 g.76417  ORF g.76417 m.76417 type:complete len:310 (+) comp8515_c1_seq1:2722-3651(+)